MGLSCRAEAHLVPARPREPCTCWQQPSRGSASGFNVRLRQWRLSAANRRTASEIAGIFTNGRLLLPKSHGARTIECARLHPEEWKMVIRGKSCREGGYGPR